VIGGGLPFFERTNPVQALFAKEGQGKEKSGNDEYTSNNEE
jgi:hypothetical protein